MSEQNEYRLLVEKKNEELDKRDNVIAKLQMIVDERHCSNCGYPTLKNNCDIDWEINLSSEKMSCDRHSRENRLASTSLPVLTNMLPATLNFDCMLSPVVEEKTVGTSVTFLSDVVQPSSGTKRLSNNHCPKNPPETSSWVIHRSCNEINVCHIPTSEEPSIIMNGLHNVPNDDFVNTSLTSKRHDGVSDDATDGVPTSDERSLLSPSIQPLMDHRNLSVDSRRSIMRRRSSTNFLAIDSCCESTEDDESSDKTSMHTFNLNNLIEEAIENVVPTLDSVGSPVTPPPRILLDSPSSETVFSMGW